MRLLFRRFKTPVYRFAHRLVADEAAAKEIVSDVFLDVWRTAGAFEGRSAVSTWLLAITRNKAIALMRRRPAETLDDDAAETIDESDGPEAILQKQQGRSILFEALKHLAPAHREIIDLVYYHERSIEEVASILNIPRATVKTRMLYARNRLGADACAGGPGQGLAAELSQLLIFRRAHGPTSFKRISGSSTDVHCRRPQICPQKRVACLSR
jgi:RNA polymerase sigma-70 factor (ECF subfamily)